MACKCVCPGTHIRLMKALVESGKFNEQDATVFADDFVKVEGELDPDNDPDSDGGEP